MQPWTQTFYETSAVHFFDLLTFAESTNQNHFHCVFFSMQIFPTWEEDADSPTQKTFIFFFN